MTTSFGMTAQVKGMFFDRKLVQREVGKENAKALSKAGAFIRTTARRSMRRRKTSSPPGSPPSVHSRDKVATLRNILFAYDRRNQSVVVGPVRLNQVNMQTGGRGNIGVPELMEHGGSVSIREVSSNRGKSWRRFDNRRTPRPWETFRNRQANYEPRPFMGPALVAEAPKFPSLWTSGRAA